MGILLQSEYAALFVNYNGDTVIVFKIVSFDTSGNDQVHMC